MRPLPYLKGTRVHWFREVLNNPIRLTRELFLFIPLLLSFSPFIRRISRFMGTLFVCFLSPMNLVQKRYSPGLPDAHSVRRLDRLGWRLVKYRSNVLDFFRRVSRCVLISPFFPDDFWIVDLLDYYSPHESLMLPFGIFIESQWS